jgi:hypothetical protein
MVANAFTASGVNLANAVIETRDGGRVYEVDTQGKEYDWGSVRIWEPGHRVVLAWTLGISGADPTEVEVSFSGSSDCVLRLEHPGLRPGLGRRPAEVRLQRRLGRRARRLPELRRDRAVAMVDVRTVLRVAMSLPEGNEFCVSR